jgi:uncharacterized protein YPO0396
MPYAGELIQVRDEERDWEGRGRAAAAHGFGLSLLVPDRAVRRGEWVDRTHLLGPLVYFRVAPREEGPARRTAHAAPDSLARKLAIKPDSPFYAWLERELAHRFDLACCNDAGAVPPRGTRHHAGRPDQGAG